MQIGQRLRLARQAVGYTIQKASREAGIGESSISEFENSKREPKFSQLAKLAEAYKKNGMAGYSKLQEKEFEAEASGYEALKHQEFVGTGYFDEVTEVATGGAASTLAMKGSTERAQFHGRKPKRRKTKK